MPTLIDLCAALGLLLFVVLAPPLLLGAYLWGRTAWLTMREFFNGLSWGFAEGRERWGWSTRDVVLSAWLDARHTWRTERP